MTTQRTEREVWLPFTITITGQVKVSTGARNEGLGEEIGSVDDAVDLLACDAHVQVNEPSDDLPGVETRQVTYTTAVPERGEG